MKVQTESITPYQYPRKSAGISSSAQGAENKRSTKSSTASKIADLPCYDVMDLNKDGYVSYYEELQYAMLYPASADEDGTDSAKNQTAADAALATGKSEGKQDRQAGENPSQSSGSIDIIV